MLILVCKEGGFVFRILGCSFGYLELLESLRGSKESNWKEPISEISKVVHLNYVILVIITCKDPSYN